MGIKDIGFIVRNSNLKFSFLSTFLKVIRLDERGGGGRSRGKVTKTSLLKGFMSGQPWAFDQTYKLKCGFSDLCTSERFTNDINQKKIACGTEFNLYL